MHRGSNIYKTLHHFVSKAHLTPTNGKDRFVIHQTWATYRCRKLQPLRKQHTHTRITYAASSNFYTRLPILLLKPRSRKIQCLRSQSCWHTHFHFSTCCCEAALYSGKLETLWPRSYKSTGCAQHWHHILQASANVGNYKKHMWSNCM